jgi:hypothetical protein
MVFGNVYNEWGDGRGYTIPLHIEEFESIQKELERLRKFKEKHTVKLEKEAVDKKGKKITVKLNEDQQKIVDLQELVSSLRGVITDLKKQVKETNARETTLIKNRTNDKREIESIKDEKAKLVKQVADLKKKNEQLSGILSEGVIVQFKPEPHNGNGVSSDSHRFKNMDLLSHDEEMEILNQLPEKKSKTKEPAKKETPQKKTAAKKKETAKTRITTPRSASSRPTRELVTRNGELAYRLANGKYSRATPSLRELYRVIVGEHNATR